MGVRVSSSSHIKCIKQCGNSSDRKSYLYYNATFDALRERFGNKIAPVVVPTLDENKKVTGLMDILNKRAYEMQDGKRVEIELPEEKVAVINEFNDALKESVAETSEEFMERFFNGEDFTYAEMAQGLRQGVRELSVFPCCAAAPWLIWAL